MATWTKETVKNPDGKETVRYKNGKDYVQPGKVPKDVVTGLEDQKDGFQVDDLGQPFDASTETDESTDEDTPDEDDQEDDAEEKETPKEATKKPRRKSRVADEDEEYVEYDDDDNEVGMGWPRKGGKTVDIFSGKPHDTVRNVAGLMVPLTFENAEGDAKNDIPAKTDAEIIEKLKDMGRL